MQHILLDLRNLTYEALDLDVPPENRLLVQTALRESDYPEIEIEDGRAVIAHRSPDFQIFASKNIKTIFNCYVPSTPHDEHFLSNVEIAERVRGVRGYCLDHVSCDLDTVRTVLRSALAETEEAIRRRS